MSATISRLGSSTPASQSVATSPKGGIRKQVLASSLERAPKWSLTRGDSASRLSSAGRISHSTTRAYRLFISITFSIVTTTPNEIPLFPVAGWEVLEVHKYGAVAIRVDFLTNTFQKASEADQGRHYVLPPAQARQLAQQILSTVDRLESAGYQPSGDPTH